ncbi:MAG: flagellin FliC [Gammaproteobacteria bacterium SHHR-1]|uniref:flagellin n=1 Tax=Magnetovirga frankeli TaxID=947516 RepID=UPI001293AC99|nr:flagellin FliC [gamma proteobacterium SS-5]
MVASISANNQSMSLFTGNRMDKTNNQMEQAMQRMSSGQRINQAKDDAAGLAVAQRMLAQFNGMNMAERNAGDASSMLGVADAATSEVNDSLMRMRDLAMQASNGLYSDSDRAMMQQEFSQLQSQVSDTLGNATFNGKPLFTSGDSVEIQVGANNGDTLSVPTGNLQSDLSNVLDSSFSIGTAADASAALGSLDTAMDQVASTQAEIGASANRMDSVISNLQSMSEAQARAEGRIMDADFARETSSMTSGQILQQSSAAMMGQASNINAQLVSGLLG